MGVMMISVQRHRAVLPVLLIACLISPAQRVVVATLDFNLLRIMVLFGWARLLLRGELRSFQFTALDYTVIAWAVTRGSCMWILRDFQFGSIVFAAGYAFDAIGLYFLFRILIRNSDDAAQVLKLTAWVGAGISVFFLIERATQYNVFGHMGGVKLITGIREGRLRCQGAFAHPILAGCFWAALIPQFAALWLHPRGRKAAAIAGALASMIIIFCCASSTPVMALMFGMMGACIYVIRPFMRLIRWSILLGLTTLHIVMEAPVWHLISRVNVIGGSTGWHRYKLMNEFINNWQDWYLFGVRSTAHWGITDITNQFVKEGIYGGLLTFILFILLIVFAFQGVGRALRRSEGNRFRMVLAWSLGVGIFIHVMNYLSVSYFGQIIMVWYLHLATIASLQQEASTVPRATAQAASAQMRPRGAPQVFT